MLDLISWYAVTLVAAAATETGGNLVSGGTCFDGAAVAAESE